MGEIAEAMLDGTFCGTCGTYMGGEAPGYPRYCSRQCDPDRYEPRVPRGSRYNVPNNPKIAKPDGPIRKGDSMSCPFCVRRVKVTGFGDHMLTQHRDKWPNSSPGDPK